MDAILKKHEEAVVDTENWDDDDLEINGDEFGYRGASYATSRAPSHRDSLSSRRSFRSEYDSNCDDEKKEVLLPGDDDNSTREAIDAATRAGVPIPKGVPASALMGGTIKRLGGRKIKKVIEDDWEIDMNIPDAKDGGLKFIYQDPSKFPESLRRISGDGFPHSSPAMRALQPAPVFDMSPHSDLQTPTLSRFNEQNDDSDFDGGDTIKVAKRRKPHQSLASMNPEAPMRGLEDDLEDDLELPEGPLTLTSPTSRDAPRTPAQGQDDIEWGESSLGIRFGGTRREYRSTRSSSASGLSPSVSSSFTLESEDEELRGLVLPTGPLSFADILEKKRLERSPDRVIRPHPNGKKGAKAALADEDFLKGLEIGDGDVFNTKSFTFNRNIKIQPVRQNSPIRAKAAVSLTFTNKPASSRPSRPNERASMTLEPVSESGGPIINKAIRPLTRLSHSAQSSISSTNSQTSPSTPRRRESRSKPSAAAVRNEPTTTSAQLLKSKRSMPILRSQNRSPAKQPMNARFERPASRTDTLSRQMSRPKTPESSSAYQRKNPLPFLPAGAAKSQSHHIASRNARYAQRHDSTGSTISSEFRPSSRSFSRSGTRSPSPPRSNNYRAAEALAREAATKRMMNKPVKKRNYGDGGELDCFDDLPTSIQAEQKYVKQPSQRGAKVGSGRRRIAPTPVTERSYTPAPFASFSSPSRKENNLPRFARDTNASRIAREQVLAQRTPSASGAPLTAITNTWKTQVNARTGLNNPPQNSTIRPKKTRRPQQLKPHLIKALGNPHTHPKYVNGMVYNAHTLRWEGNDNELSPFDVPEIMTPRPALISNVNATHKAPQISGSMVFDPVHMTWYQLPTSSCSTRSNDTMDGFEDDTFKDIPDLQDNTSTELDESGMKSTGAPCGDDWLVGEEFDVGPEFVRRQREEEERWRRKCEKWRDSGRDWLERDGEDPWRWALRSVVSDDDSPEHTEDQKE